MRWALLVVGLGTAGGCDEPRVQPSPQPTPPAVAAPIATIDTPRIGDLYQPLSDGRIDNARLIAIVDSLQRSMQSAAPTDKPAYLLAIGRAKFLMRPDRKTEFEAYALSRPQDFRYNEVGGNYIYTGADFDSLRKSYPTHDLVDDAAYQTMLLWRGGECEGYIACYAGWFLPKVKTFLETHPTSPLVRPAIDRFFEIYENAIDNAGDLAVPTEHYDTGAVRGILRSFDSLAVKLPDSMRTHAKQRSTAVWKRFGY